MQNMTDEIILVELHREPELSNELRTVTDVASDRGDCDVILDFSEVDIVTSQGISKLLKLRQLLIDNGHRLIFCGVNNFTKSSFEVTGLDGIFKLADSRESAMNELRQGK